MNLRVGSVSSGIGGDAVAWHDLGWESVFFSEIDAFPCAALAERYPNVPNLGDFTADDFCDRAQACGSIDVFAGGTPCQSFSIAGKRGSLDDDRGNLTLRFVEIVHELNPAIVVWENVPGVLSTEDNAFGCFLCGMVGAETALIPCDDCRSDYAKRYWRTRTLCDEEGKPAECWRYPVWPDYGMVAGPKRTLAWRILDAQHFGLAQRRRRVVVVSFRAGDQINPGAVLFEPESLRRYSAPSREAGAHAAPTLAARTKGGGGLGTDFECDGGLIPEISPAIKARDHKGPSSDGDGDGAPLIPTVTHALTGEGFDASEDGTGRGTPLVPVGFNSRQDPDVSGEIAGALDGGHPQAQAIAYQCQGGNVGPMGALRKGNGNEAGGVPFVAIAENGRGEVREMDVVPALSAGGGKPGSGYPAVAMVTPGDRGISVDQAAAGMIQPAVAFVERGRKGGRSCESQEDIAYALLNPGEGGRTSEGCIVDPVLRVRRLMPRECEKLQGFPTVENVIDFGIHAGTLQSCIGHPRNYVSAAAKSLRLQNNASLVESAEWSQYVKSAVRPFCTCRQTNDAPVVATVRANFAVGMLQLHNAAGELIWSVNTASESDASPRRMPVGGFAQLVAAISICVERIQRTGTEDLPLRAEPSIAAEHGSWRVEMSGPSIGGAACDVDKSTWQGCGYMKSIISSAMQNTQALDSTVATLFSCVLTAITGFIPAKTLRQHSCILRLITTDAWTRIPWRKKTADKCPDGPRYKGLGNAWATHMFRWLGHRIELVLMALKKRPRWLRVPKR